MKQNLNIVESTKNNTKCSSTDSKPNLNKNMFEFKYIIGKGGFGKVWRVRYKKTNEYFALKEMSKKKIIDKKSEKSINNERIFLSKLHHPFLVNMHFAFQDHDNLYLVIDILNGGDLRFHCSRYRRFSEEQTRFFIACMVHTLSYIHQKNVIHRDIKPENLVLDDKGYRHITDFGIAKENCEDNSSETSGTPGYMAPEVIRGLGHSFSVDFFAIGIIGYEFMIGKRPYNGKNRKEIKEQMFSHQARIKRSELVKGWSMESRDFINKLLLRKPEIRLGCKEGIKELKEHFWLKYYPWNELEKKSLPGPFVPEKRDNFDKRYCEGIDKISESTKLRSEEIAMSDNYKTAFANFYFNKEEITDLKAYQNSCLVNNNNLSLPKDNLNSPDNSCAINNLVSSKSSELAKVNPIKQNNDNKSQNNSNNNHMYNNNYINNNSSNLSVLHNDEQSKNINNYIYAKLNQKTNTLKNKVKKGKIHKSASHQIYEGIKSLDKSLYSLLNSNSGIFSVKNKNKKLKEEKKVPPNICDLFKNKNNSFTNIGIKKKDGINNNQNIINKKIIEYHSNDKRLSLERQPLADPINKEHKSMTFLLKNNSSHYNINIHPNYKLGFSSYNNNIRNKILYNQIYKSNLNNITMKNKKDLIKNSKRNNSFLLKKNNSNLDLSSIRLYNLQKNSLTSKKYYNINIQEIKGNKTSRKDIDNSNQIIFKEYQTIIRDDMNRKHSKTINRNKSAELIHNKKNNKLTTGNKNYNFINNYNDNIRKIF